MTKRAPDNLTKLVIDRQWGSLRRRHNGNGRTKHGTIPISKDEFACWLVERSVGMEGICWRCEYTGNVLTAMGKTQAAMLTVDHRVPLAKGGTTTLDNLAVCSAEANHVKGDNSYGYYARLMSFLSTWPPDEKESVIRRLKAYEPIWRKRRG